MSNIVITARTRIVDPLREFMQAEVAVGVVLLATALTALCWASSPFSGSNQRLWASHLSLGAGPLVITTGLQYWVNGGLMAVFVVVGLEIKRQLVVGALRDHGVAVPPAVAAAGGVLPLARCSPRSPAASQRRRAEAARWPPTSPSPAASWRFSASPAAHAPGEAPGIAE